MTPTDADRPSTPRALSPEGIRLGLSASDKGDAIAQAADLLVALGAADSDYADSMVVREGQVSTYMGNGVAVPHGTNEARASLTTTTIGVLQFPDGVEWNGKTAYVVVPIASNPHDHVTVLAALASVIADRGRADQLRKATDPAQVLELLASV